MGDRLSSDSRRGDPNVKLVTVETFSIRQLAELAASQLREAGIDATVFADDAGGAYPHLGFVSPGVQLLVRESDLAAARAVLE